MKIAFIALCLVINMASSSADPAPRPRELQHILADCAKVTQDSEFFNSSASTFNHAIRCKDGTCRCGVYNFQEVYNVRQSLLDPAQPVADSESSRAHFKLNDPNVIAGMKNFRTVMQLPSATNTSICAAAFSTDPETNLIAGRKGWMFNTMFLWSNVMKKCFDLIQELTSLITTKIIPAFKSLKDENTALKAEIASLNLRHETENASLKAKYETEIASLKTKNETEIAALKAQLAERNATSGTSSHFRFTAPRRNGAELSIS